MLTLARMEDDRRERGTMWPRIDRHAATKTKKRRRGVPYIAPYLVVCRGWHQVVRKVKLCPLEPTGIGHDPFKTPPPSVPFRRPCQRARGRRRGRGVRVPGPALEPLDAAEIRNGLPKVSHLRNRPMMEVRPAGVVGRHVAG